VLIDPNNWPSSPAPAKIRAARITAGITQSQAGALIYSRERTWAGWERGENPLHPALWELWQMRAADADWVARLE
jgi:DNA-binding XRE family transcriptional regulator